MIQFYHKGKKVCSMPIEDLTIPQMLMGRAITAKRLGVSTNCVEFKYVEEEV